MTTAPGKDIVTDFVDSIRAAVVDLGLADERRALGYSPQVAEIHARDSGATWVTYASYRSLGTSSRGNP